MFYLIFIVLTLSGMLLHPLHFSITNIDINSKHHTVEISYQFFADDFKRTLQSNNCEIIELEQDKELTAKYIKTINNYIFSAFKIKFDECEEVSLNYQDKKQDEALIWLYYKGKLPPGRIKNISLVNELMLNLYEDQTNLVIISFDSEEKGYTFNYRKRTAIIELSN